MAAALDSQTLLSEAKCLECFTNGGSEQLIELALLAKIAHMATDPQTLYTQSKCYLCYGMSQYQALKLALLAQISVAHNAANDTTPATLLSQGKCFPCFSNSDTGKVMELALLAQIAT